MKKWIVFVWIIFSSIPLLNPGVPLASEGETRFGGNGKGSGLESHGGKFAGRPRRRE